MVLALQASLNSRGIVRRDSLAPRLPFRHRQAQFDGLSLCFLFNRALSLGKRIKSTRIGVGLVALFLVLASPGAMAQNVDRQSYVMSEAMHHELDSRDFDSQRVEQIVNGISNALVTKSIGPILDAASAEIRITEKGTNKVIGKAQLASYRDRLFKDADLMNAIADESQFILQSDTVGLGRGTFWISEQCLNDKCDQKKTLIVTINLP